jgi:hypothetical protein
MLRVAVQRYRIGARARERYTYWVGSRVRIFVLILAALVTVHTTTVSAPVVYAQSPSPSPCSWPDKSCEPQWFIYPGFDPTCQWSPPRPPDTVCQIHSSLPAYLESCWLGFKLCCESRLKTCERRCGEANSSCKQCCALKHRTDCWIYTREYDQQTASPGQLCQVLGSRFCDLCPGKPGCPLPTLESSGGTGG